MSAINLDQIKRLVEYLSPQDKLLLAEALTQQSGQPEKKPRPQSMRGAWKDTFPPDFDIDAELKEIRTE
jgi:hypothetical protein